MKDISDSDVIFYLEKIVDEGKELTIADTCGKICLSASVLPSDIVVLQDGEKIEEMLMRNAIPYKVLAGLRFYDRKEIKDMLKLLKLKWKKLEMILPEKLLVMIW